jgi:hypothetical protein
MTWNPLRLLKDAIKHAHRRRQWQAMLHQPSRAMLHRDDVPMEVAEQIGRVLTEKFPGETLVFPGDIPEGPEREFAERAVARTDDMIRERFRRGQCFICGAQYGGSYPPISDAALNAWDQSGWCVLGDGARPRAPPDRVACPACAGRMGF